MQVLSQVDGFRQSVVVAFTATVPQSVEFAHVGCKYELFGQLLHPSLVRCEDVQGIGIYHHGTLCSANLRDKRDGGIFVLSHARTHAHGIVVLGIERFGEEIIFLTRT